jgi:chromosome segregation ATPase
MSVTLEELSSRIDRIEKYLKTLIDVNLELVEEVEPENWEIEDLDERRKDEFLDWKSIENEL